jgi:RNA polymerase sigma factor (sigma-70 family)
VKGGGRLVDLNSIYSEHADEVFRYLMCLCHNPDLSEELTQETFYQALKSIDRYNGECKLSVWLCQIAKHSYYKYLERRKKHQHHSIEDFQEYLLSPASPETQLINAEDKLLFFRKIHSLEEPYREIMLLRTLGDLSFKEIGDIQGKTENWARVTFYRGKIKLQERR